MGISTPGSGSNDFPPLPGWSRAIDRMDAWTTYLRGRYTPPRSPPLGRLSLAGAANSSPKRTFTNIDQIHWPRGTTSNIPRPGDAAQTYHHCTADPIAFCALAQHTVVGALHLHPTSRLQPIVMRDAKMNGNARAYGAQADPHAGIQQAIHASTTELVPPRRASIWVNIHQVIEACHLVNMHVCMLLYGAAALVP